MVTTGRSVTCIDHLRAAPIDPAEAIGGRFPVAGPRAYDLSMGGPDHCFARTFSGVGERVPTKKLRLPERGLLILALSLLAGCGQSTNEANDVQPVTTLRLEERDFAIETRLTGSVSLLCVLKIRPTRLFGVSGEGERSLRCLTPAVFAGRGGFPP